ncbi:MAG TPA: winged helix-turn-helix domain-containing protein [Terracidiphilus sp.]|nr:winged helix-turn-helix domain-containing protein [Terracidiphilus sp.]
MTPEKKEQPTFLYRFGAFEADVSTGELRRQGVRVKLHSQPFRMLAKLLERPGELVTREEIAKELWPDGTFVDFEHGVNSAVNRIREALGDSAANPRFVETLARRGYRFVAPVQRLGEEAGHVPPDESEALPEVLPRAGRILASHADFPKTSRSVVQALFLLLQLMYLGFYVSTLANLGEIRDLLAPLPRADVWLDGLTAAAMVLIPVRVFLFSAAAFHAPRFARNFGRLWPVLLVVDVAWAMSPILLLHHIPVGLALACMAPLVYAPFAQRSLVLMGAGLGKGERRPVSL